jgi:hypothetical protein
VDIFCLKTPKRIKKIAEMLTNNPAHVAEITNRFHDQVARLPSSQRPVDDQLFVKILTDVLDNCIFDVDLEVYYALLKFQPLPTISEIQPEDNFCDL